MKLTFTFSTLDEIESFATSLIDAHPVGLTLSVDGMEEGMPEPQRPPYPQTEDELTLHDLALYFAGEMQVYQTLVNDGEMTMTQVAKFMEIPIDQLEMTRLAWTNGGVIEQRDAFVHMAINAMQKG